MDTREKMVLICKGFTTAFCNFCYSKLNHSGNTNTMILKWGEKKKGSRSILKSTEIFWHLKLDLIPASDTTGSQLPAPPFFKESYWVLPRALTAVTQYLTGRCPMSYRVCYSQVSLAGISPSPQELSKLSAVGKMKITTAVTHIKLSNVKSSRSTGLNMELLHILSPR